MPMKLKTENPALTPAQARALARFPVDNGDRQLGALIRNARNSSIAFRESVRQEITGGIVSQTNNAAYDHALDTVAGRSSLAADTLKSVERVLARR